MAKRDFKSMMAAEVGRLRGKKPVGSFHEAFALILEEVEEFKEETWKKAKARNHANALLELAQIAAICQVAAEDLKLCDM